jgi:hypothetical protein
LILLSQREISAEREFLGGRNRPHPLSQVSISHLGHYRAALNNTQLSKIKKGNPTERGGDGKANKD